jgi:arylsulfatase A-like enzyme
LDSRPNIIVVVSDTLRASALGCYGNTVVQTPHMDRFAEHATRFTRAYPESLPTIPVRRTLHTGRRAFPFRDYHPLKWDIVTLPGWQPMSNDEDTVAENLAAAGYQTGFVTDTLPYFAPGLNFTRGFWQWEFVRGQQQDRWKSPYSVTQERLARYGDPEELSRDPHQLVPMHLANTAHVRTEEDTSTARTFACAAQFLRDNVRGQPFYLMVDCFDPHEPWEAPEPYYRMYGDPTYKGRRIVHCKYMPADEAGYSAEEVAYVQAQYHGLVTLVDTWFGRLMATLEETGLADNTAVLLVSDHGTNFCDNPRRVIGKPAYSLYPGLMQLPLLVRVPGAGGVREELVSNLDIPATVYDLTGVKPAQEIHGRSLLPLLGRGQAGAWERREYVTCRYGNYVSCIDDETWAIGEISGAARELFDLTRDPRCMSPLDAGAPATRSRWETSWRRILSDAGGGLPDYARARQTDAIGEKPASSPWSPTSAGRRESGGDPGKSRP